MHETDYGRRYRLALEQLLEDYNAGRDPRPSLAEVAAAVQAIVNPALPK